jgi:heat shock protein HslJ
MRILALAGALAATTFVAGCGQTAGMPTPTTTEPLSLERTKWSLVESRLEAPPPEKQDIVELQFTGDRIAAHSGCNRGGRRLPDREWCAHHHADGFHAACLHRRGRCL